MNRNRPQTWRMSSTVKLSLLLCAVVWVGILILAYA